MLRRTRIGSYAPPYGACTVVASAVGSGDPLNLTENPGPGWAVSIDANTTLNLNGPLGARHWLNDNSAGLGGGIPGYTDSFGPEYLVPGVYTVDNGNGSSNIGAYRATLTLPAPIAWTNQSSVSAITRSQDVTVTWAGGDDSREFVMIGGLSSDTNLGVGALFACTERPSAGRFTVPRLVLSSLPPSGTMNLGGQLVPSGYLQVVTISMTEPNRFHAQGLDTGIISYTLNTVKVLSYQ